MYRGRVTWRIDIFPYKDSFAVDPMKILEVQEQIRNFLPEDLTVVRTAAFYLEIFPAESTKDRAFVIYAEF